MSTRNNKASTKSQRKSEPNVLLESHIGNVIRKVRNEHHLTIAEISSLAEISTGMLSRIERADVSPSLEILEKIAKALGVPISRFFKDYDLPVGSAQHVKKNSGMEVIRRGTKKGHTYRLLAYEHGPKKSFEPFLVVMDDQSEVFPSFQHEGIEFVYILKGKLEYRHGSNSYLLEPGDSLMFQGDIPHGPEKLIKVPIELLAIINYKSENST